MKPILSFLAILLFSFNSAGAQDVQQRINEQVWLPFMKTFSERDAEGFIALHSRDAVRSPRDAKIVLDRDEYYQRYAKGSERARAAGIKVDLDLRFTERIASNDLAVEVGIYKTTYTTPEGTTSDHYGRFHVVLRKENGAWKILVDTDSTEGGTISEKDYLAASPIQ